MAEEEIEATHNNLMQISFPTSIIDLKHPNEEYVTSVYRQFFSYFSMDLIDVLNLSMDQLDIIFTESPETIVNILSIGNLRSAIVSFAPELFIDNLSLTEFVSPTPKKTRHRIKFIINFIFFSNVSKEKIQVESEQVHKLSSTIEKLRLEKNESIEEMNATARKTAINVDYSKKTNVKSNVIEPRCEGRRNIISNKQKDYHLHDEKKSQKYEHLKKNKLDLLKLTEKRNLLVSKIVKNPREIKDEYDNLNTELEDKFKESENVQDKIKQNRPRIENTSNAFDCVKSEQKILSRVKEFYENLTTEKLRCQGILAKIDDASKEVNCEESSKSREQVDKIDNYEKSKFTAEAEKKLKKLKTTASNLLQDKKVCENDFQVTKQKELEIRFDVDKGKRQVTEHDNSIQEFVDSCQELYDIELEKIEKIYEKIEMVEED